MPCNLLPPYGVLLAKGVMAMRQSQARSDWVNDIVDKYANMVYRIAFTHMKNKTDSDDIFQEVFLKLCKSPVKYESDEHVKAWLIKVTVNTCKKSFSTAWHRKTTGLSEEIAHEDRYQDFEIVPVVQSLPAKYLTVIHLFYFEDMPVAEIAQVLDVTVSTIKSRLSRARNLLRNKLKGEFVNA